MPMRLCSLRTSACTQPLVRARVTYSDMHTCALVSLHDNGMFDRHVYVDAQLAIFTDRLTNCVIAVDCCRQADRS